MRRHVAEDLAEQGAECGGGGGGEAYAGFACRPDCHIGGRVKEVGDVVEAVNEGEADNRRCRTTGEGLVYNGWDYSKVG